MASFFIGQRVRILWSKGWPDLAGQEGVIVGPTDTSGLRGNCEWIVAPDCWGSHNAPYPSLMGGGRFGPNSRQLAPISDSNTLVSWESMKELWTPERLGEVV